MLNVVVYIFLRSVYQEVRKPLQCVQKARQCSVHARASAVFFFWAPKSRRITLKQTSEEQFELSVSSRSPTRLAEEIKEKGDILRDTRNRKKSS